MQDNILNFKKPANDHKPSYPPLLNIPPVTKYLCFAIIVSHLAVIAAGYLFPNFDTNLFYYELGFVPARWSGHIPFEVWTPLSLLTVNLLHGGFFHLGINIATLVAFGAGLEKTMGGKMMLLVFVVSSLISTFAHFAIAPDSLNPVIGASGGISGLFGAMLVILKRRGDLGESQRILPFVFLWIGVAMLSGYMGAPDGSSVAWIAHIGGFLGGLGFMALWLKKRY